MFSAHVVLRAALSTHPTSSQAEPAVPSRPSTNGTATDEADESVKSLSSSCSRIEDKEEEERATDFAMVVADHRLHHLVSVRAHGSVLHHRS